MEPAQGSGMPSPNSERPNRVDNSIPSDNLRRPIQPNILPRGDYGQRPVNRPRIYTNPTPVPTPTEQPQLSPRPLIQPQPPPQNQFDDILPSDLGPLPETEPVKEKRSIVGRLVGSAIFVFTVATLIVILFYPSVKSTLISAKNISTPTSDFQTYSLTNNRINFTIQFYKNATQSGQMPQLTSTGLSGGRLPLSFGILAVPNFVAQVSPEQVEACPTVNNVSTLAFTTFNKNTDSYANVCVLDTAKSGSAYVYTGNFSDAFNEYTLQIALEGSHTTPASKLNLNEYTSDLKYIIDSIKPSQPTIEQLKEYAKTGYPQ